MPSSASSKTDSISNIDPFDNLVKSRFIEMFGTPTKNEKQWPTEKMKEAAPAIQSDNLPQPEGNWLLNLDAIQSNSGEILFKNLVSESELSGSIMSFSSEHVLYSKLRPYLNKVAVPDESGYGTNELIPLLPNKSKLTRTYLAHLLRSDAFVSKFSSAVAGTKMPRVSMDVFWKFDVPLPPMELQEKFESFVQQVDKSKFIYQQLVSYFDDLIKTRFIEMFGNLDINDKHWEMSTIGNSASVPLHYGSTASAVDYDSEIRYVRITDIDSDGKLSDDFKSPSIYDSSYLLNKGDILFARSGSVGVTYLFDEDYKSIFAGYLIRFIPDKEKLDPEFAYQFTRSAYCQGILVGSKRGGVQKNVNAKQLSAIPIPLPPMDLQKEFVDFVHQVDKSKFTIQQHLLKTLNSTAGVTNDS